MPCEFKILLIVSLCVTSVVLLSSCVSTAFNAVSASAAATSAYFDFKTSEAAEPIIVAPDLVQYTPDVQDRAADELSNLKPCSSDVVFANCSAVARMVIDYGRMREQIRTIKQD